jgi:hypothetical protein
MSRKHFPKTKKIYNYNHEEDPFGWFVADCVTQRGEKLGKRVMFKCPKCKQFGCLTLHSIDRNGEVNASLLHHYPIDGKETCGYHEFIVLDGWPRDYIKKAGDEYLTKVK